jgi:DNA-directed RNA polymerase subunit RPC12/RpoP
MEFIPAVCPSCGGDLRVPANLESVKCSYCGIEILIKRDNQTAANLQNLLELASTAYKAGNLAESYRYYANILEIDLSCYGAWIGKGESAGWMSTLDKPRLEESLECFKAAIKHAPESECDPVRARVSESLISIIVGHHELARTHVIRFKTVFEAARKYRLAQIMCVTMLSEISDILPQEQVLSNKLAEKFLRDILVMNQVLLGLCLHNKHLARITDLGLITKTNQSVNKALGQIAAARA